MQHELHFDGIEGGFNATVRCAINQTRVEQRCGITVSCFHVTPVFMVPPRNIGAEIKYQLIRR